MQVLVFDLQHVDPVAHQVVHQVRVHEVSVARNVAVARSYQLDLHAARDGPQQLLVELLQRVVVRTDDLDAVLRGLDLLQQKLAHPGLPAGSLCRPAGKL